MSTPVIKFTAARSKALLTALVALDGADKIAQLGNGLHQVVKRPYKFAAKTRMAIARNIVPLNEARLAFDKAHNAIIEAAAGEGQRAIDPTDRAKVAEVNKQYDDLLAAETEFPTLRKLKASELNIEENELPQSVIADLMPLLDDDIPVD